MKIKHYNRRTFLNNTIGLSTSTAGMLILPRYLNINALMAKDVNLNHIGPLEGYTPQVGTLISMLDWLSDSVIGVAKNLTVDELDYLHDSDSNSIGALMLHIAATEVIYQDITFHQLDDFSGVNKLKWNVAMELGPDAQVKIKGNPLAYYVEAMDEARATTKKEMKKRNDSWLLSGETKEWDWNNYCKWFHVAEHFANHRGQMTWYKKRLPKK
ncbi:MAG: DUF664 domain-containing protein [Saprospiraceae bacterium]|nr:DUF664 domain-containing protein [Saprospiraceae bacterium]